MGKIHDRLKAKQQREAEEKIYFSNRLAKRGQEHNHDNAQEQTGLMALDYSSLRGGFPTGKAMTLGTGLGSGGQNGYQPHPLPDGQRMPLPPGSSHHLLEDYEVHAAFDKHKYIVALHPQLGEVALTFPNFLVHAEMAQRVFRGLRIVAAGFLDIYPDGEVTVKGRSESLDLDSRRGTDEALIQKSLGLNW